MFGKKGKIVLLILFVVFSLLAVEILIRSLLDKNKTHLRKRLKQQTYTPITIDVSFTKTILTEPETVKRNAKEREEETRKLREQTNTDTITIVGLGIAQPDGSEIRLSKRRMQIGTGKRLRIDTTMYANTQKTETILETTRINTGYKKDSPSYEIDHKIKRFSISNGRWSDFGVLRYGKVDGLIEFDIRMFCTNRLLSLLIPKREFRHVSKVEANGKVVDELEGINRKSGKAVYKISFDADNWRLCRKIVRYDKESGLVSEIIVYKDFKEAEGNKELFPRLIIKRHFNEVGKEESVETINVTNVVLGLSIPNDVFNVNIPDGYSVVDYRNINH